MDRETKKRETERKRGKIRREKKRCRERKRERERERGEIKREKDRCRERERERLIIYIL